MPERIPWKDSVDQGRRGKESTGCREIGSLAWLVDFIELGLSTGMRTGELLGLTWERVDLGQRLVYLQSENQKNNTHGSVPVNEQIRQALLRRFKFTEQYCPKSEFVFCDKEGGRIQSIERGFETACDRAGIKDFTPHGLRHPCAAWLVQNDVPIRTVSGLLRQGHQDNEALRAFGS
jgi:integrase